MYYPFPAASHVDDYLGAIHGSPEFFVRRDDEHGFIVINYAYVCDTTFPSPTALMGQQRWHAILRRECRGIEFDARTGEVVTRKYHKFHNLNEKAETQVNSIDWTQPHHILEKLDGSMVTPYLRADGRYQWHSKVGLSPMTGPVNRYVETSDRFYERFAATMHEADKTAIFEWCSPHQRIVVDYPTDQLILTAVRDRRTGAYETYETLQRHAKRFGLPIVRAVEVEDVRKFLNTIGELEGAEGYVVRFADGHAVKLKGLWYGRVHNLKELLQHEKNVWDLLLSNRLDDIKPFLLDEDRRAIEEFAGEFYQRLHRTIDNLAWKLAEARRRCADKKEFALYGMPYAQQYERAVMFRLWDGHDPWQELVSYLSKNISSQTKVDTVRLCVEGLSWGDFYGTIDE